MMYKGRGMDSRLMQYAVKNMVLKSVSGKSKGADIYQEFYRDVCSLRLPNRGKSVDMRLPQSMKKYVAPANTAFRDLTPVGNGRFMGIEVYSRRLVEISCEDGMRDLPVEYGAFALTGTPDGFAFIASTDQRFTVLNRDLTIHSNCSLKDFGVSANGATRITTSDDSFVVVVPESRKVLFIDKDLRLKKSVNLPYGSTVHDVVGYNGGVLLSESVPVCNESGALLWMNEHGDVFTIFEELDRPFGLSTYQDCILVGDFRGLHFVHVEGMIVVGHQCIPWNEFAQKAQARSGYIYESVIQSDRVTTIVRLASGGISTNTNFCLCEFDLNDIS